MSRSTSPLQFRLQTAEGALAMAEAKCKEQTEIMADLLISIGTRTACPRCGEAVWWIMVPRENICRLINVNGTAHYPLCIETARLAAVAGGE